VVTGGFGVLGLLKDFKNKITNKVTGWGYVSLGGILISSGLGVAAQLKESSDQENARRAATAQTLALAKNTDQTVHDLQRVLSSIDDPHLYFDFDLNCSQGELKEFCAGLNSYTPALVDPYSGASVEAWQQKRWSFLSSKKAKGFWMQMVFYVDPKDAQLFLDGAHAPPDLSFYLNLAYDQHTKTLLIVGVSPEHVHLSVRNLSPGEAEFQSTEKIRSMADLRGATAIMNIVSRTFDFDHMTPTHFAMRLRSGQMIAFEGPWSKVTVQNHAMYSFTIPKER
jgi:hypothetical protein